MFKRTGSSYWRRTKLWEKFREEIQGIRYIGGDHKTVAVKGRSLKEAEVSRALLDWDVFINMPIAKDHTAVRFTGTMKNMMGLTSSSTNHFFHFGSGSNGWYDDGEDILATRMAHQHGMGRLDLSAINISEVTL